MDPDYETTCKNQQLKNNKQFWVEIACTQGNNAHTFKVVLEKGDDTFLSRLDAHPGECIFVNTLPDSKQCGLETGLMYSCLKDEDITKNGGVNPKTNCVFKSHPDQQALAEKKCDIIVYLKCLPGPKDPKDTCMDYFNAAAKAEYDYLFTAKKEISMDGMTLINAMKSLLNTGVRIFIGDHGSDWYFCKYKQN